MKKSKKGGLERKLKTITIVPVLIMGIIVTVLSYYVLVYTTQKEVERNLKNMAECVVLYYDTIFPGEYVLDKTDGKVYKGDTELNSTETVLDNFKNISGIDFTIFYVDVRIATTITGEDGNKIDNTTVNYIVADHVINSCKSIFYDNIDISGTKYFAYYQPLYNKDGVVGMIFAGKPTAEVELESMQAILFIPIVTIVMTLVAGWFSLVPARKLVDDIQKEKKFLDDISKGKLNTEIDSSVIKRDDELGDMGRFSKSVQKFIREMIERDTLTRLYTRRIGETKINYVQNQLNQSGVKYCVCMGDIDYFKKVNDTYGHDSGDVVLKEVARIFNENMLGHGFTIRWGGEEFLIIFEDADINKAYGVLSDIRQKVIEHVMISNGEKISVTMTFGLTEGDNRPIEDIVKEADNLLYIGKQNGRNQIVTSEISQLID